MRSGEERHWSGARTHGLEPQGCGSPARSELSHIAVQDRAIPHDGGGPVYFSDAGRPAGVSGPGRQERQSKLRAAMARKSYSLGMERIGMLLLCAVLPSGLAAQTATGSGTPQANAPAKTDTASHPAADPSGKAHDDTFVIGNDDVLAINVWNEKEISRSVPVRSDGRISLPLVGEVQAAGQTPLKLEVE